MKERWEEWRGRWCWIEEEDPPAFCEVRREPPVRGNDWGDVDADDEKLTTATTRILRLTEAGLTLEMIGRTSSAAESLLCTTRGGRPGFSRTLPTS